jgi:hypothetical protein
MTHYVYFLSVPHSSPSPTALGTMQQGLPRVQVGQPRVAEEGLSEAFWLPCCHKGHQRGRVLVQAQYVRRVQVRPLRVLLVTWNLGNAAPSAAFQQCFPESSSCAPPLLPPS